MIFKRVGNDRPYPEHGLSPRDWASLPPRQVRLEELVTTKDTLQLDALLDEDSTFFGDLFALANAVAAAVGDWSERSRIQLLSYLAVLPEHRGQGHGGRLLEPGQTPELLDALRSNVPAAALAVRRDLWHNGWSLLVLISLLAAEWLLRRRWGLR